MSNLVGHVTLNPLVLTVEVIPYCDARWPWYAVVIDQNGRRLASSVAATWRKARQQGAHWALSYIQTRGGRVLLPVISEDPEAVR